MLQQLPLAEPADTLQVRLGGVRSCALREVVSEVPAEVLAEVIAEALAQVLAQVLAEVLAEVLGESPARTTWNPPPAVISLPPELLLSIESLSRTV